MLRFLQEISLATQSMYLLKTKLHCIHCHQKPVINHEQNEGWWRKYLEFRMDPGGVHCLITYEIETELQLDRNAEISKFFVQKWCRYSGSKSECTKFGLLSVPVYWIYYTWVAILKMILWLLAPNASVNSMDTLRKHVKICEPGLRNITYTC